MTEWKDRRRLAKNEDHIVGQPQWYSRGYLPHFDQEGLTQTLTFRLFDSMPQAVLDVWREELRLVPEREANRERRERIDAYLDQGHGSCYLRDDRLAEIVQNALLHFDSQRYRLHAWVVMPNHVHTLYTAQPGWELSQIAHSWKSYTDSECNRVLKRKGEFWQRNRLIVTSGIRSISRVRCAISRRIRCWRGCVRELKTGNGVVRTDACRRERRHPCLLGMRHSHLSRNQVLARIGS